MEKIITLKGGVIRIMEKKEYVSPAVSGRNHEGEFIIPALAAAIAAAAASAAVKSLMEHDFSALDVEPLPACITA